MNTFIVSEPELKNRVSRKKDVIEISFIFRLRLGYLPKESIHPIK
ncbi:hypothetical protein [Legionella taurinensis]|nr:hypothetical protein [Legionella taurinensis]MDX1837061.1 hypothetical protein [Legionella taurinensis]